MAEMRRPAERLKYAVMAMDVLVRAGVALPRSWDAALEEIVRSLDLGDSIRR